MPVTVQEFILFFDDSETSELSMLNIPDDPDIYEPRIQFHLDLAEEEFWSALSCVNRDNPPASVLGASKKWIITIARHSLDHIHRRESVTEEYEKFYELYCEQICPKSGSNSDSGSGNLDLIDLGGFVI